MNRIVLIVMAALVATSCTTVREEPVPPVEFGDAFSANGDMATPDQWWLAFDDPGLNQLVDQALAANLDLMGVWDRLDQVRALADEKGQTDTEDA